MSGETLFVLGATHHTAPIEVRERLSVPAESAEALRAELANMPGLREFTMVSTCNRIEFYGVADNPAVANEVQRAFCTRQKFTAEEFERFRLSLAGPGVVQHLLEVTAGLDSQMLGETEILGQVKEAYGSAQAKGHTGAVLNRVFQKAFQAAKHVRSNTAITEGQVSIANVAVELAGNIFGSLAETRILLVGAGDIGEKTAKAFQSRGAGGLTVSSRRLERAMELANQLGALALPFNLMPNRLGEFDVVVCATSAPDVVVTLPAVKAAMSQRPARPLFLIDLALPRDVDATVADLENVFLYNLDDLAKIAEQNRAAREAEIGKCRALIAERATSLWRQVEGRLQGGNPSAGFPQVKVEG
ncbi:MAG TPA: glutamyl-tRNA reductase [Opitutaceae bacterium]|nr:glutamyl-tRNA reductase [Opitutaceae bacterium]HND60818.1 glutamyl-tRNA reductase [Opitutaceae bacterium]